jgi:hypothetical protein
MNQQIMRDYLAAGSSAHLLFVYCTIALSLLLQRYLILKFHFVSPKKLTDKIKQLLREGRAQEAYNVCLSSSHPITRLIATQLYHLNKGKNKLASALPLQLKSELLALNKNSQELKILATLTPVVTLCLLILANYLKSSAGKFLLSFGAILTVVLFAAYEYFFAWSKNITLEYEYLCFEVDHLTEFRESEDTVNERYREDLRMDV